MNVIVHYPKNAENIGNLQKRVAKIYAQTVVSYIQKLPCPKAQKMQLLKEVEQSLRYQSANSGLAH